MPDKIEPEKGDAAERIAAALRNDLRLEITVPGKDRSRDLRVASISELAAVIRAQLGKECEALAEAMKPHSDNDGCVHLDDIRDAIRRHLCGGG